jgi:type VI secretion system secreted protein VgrG
VALRAGAGMLLSTHGSPGATRDALESGAAVSQIKQAHELQVNLTEAAQKHNARLLDEHKDPEPEPKQLPAISAMDNSIEVLKQVELGVSSGSPESDGSGGGGQVIAFSEKHLQLSSPVGIAAATPRNAVLSSLATTSLVAGRDINVATQGNYLHAVKDGISMFTYGQASDPQKPNQETGIRLHTASGKVSTQSQSDETRITADRDLTVNSGATVTVSAPTHVLLNAAGAYVKLAGGDIMLHAPGVVSFMAGFKELAGGGGGGAIKPPFNVGELKGCEVRLAGANKAPGTS